MAYWGEAMAYNQTLWLNQDADAARTALAGLGRRLRRGWHWHRPGEKGYLRAIEALYGSGERAARDRARGFAMGRLAAATGRPRGAGFLALALMGTAARSPALLGDPGDDAHQHALVGSDVPRSGGDPSIGPGP